MEQLRQAAGRLAKTRVRLPSGKILNEPGMAALHTFKDAKTSLLARRRRHLNNPKAPPGRALQTMPADDVLDNVRTQSINSREGRLEARRANRVLTALQEAGQGHRPITLTTRGGFARQFDRGTRKAKGIESLDRIRSMSGAEKAEMQKGLNAWAEIHEANESARMALNAKKDRWKPFRPDLQQITASHGHEDFMVPLLDHNMITTAKGPGSEAFRDAALLVRSREAPLYQDVVRAITKDPNWTFGVSPKLNRHTRRRIERAIREKKLGLDGITDMIDARHT
jgi:hypothetical protein